MKSMMRLTLIGILCVSILACTSKKSTTATTPQTTNTTTANTPLAPPVAAAPVATPKSDAGIRFGVSFFSIGGGIDMNTKDEFVRFLNAYPKKIAFEPKQWGREGEVDYCLALSELTAAEQVDFVKKANDILRKSKLVHTKENTKCDHADWTAPVAEDDVYRLVVSFYSEGGGTDLKNKDEFVKFLNSYPKKISFEPTTWGREGETDYCLKLSELSASEQTDFIKKAKEILSKSRLVHVDENAKCVHKH